MPKEIVLQPQQPEGFATSAMQELSYLEEAMGSGGFLTSMAARLVEPGTALTTPEDVVAVYEHVLRPNHPGNGPRPRGEILGTAPGALKEICNEEPNKAATLSLAKILGIRQDETYPARQIESVTADPQDVVFYARGAANKSGAVRPAVIEQALPLIEAARGVSFEDPIIWQFGIRRPVPVLRRDGSANPEHGIVRKLAPDFLPAGLDSTEFENNVAIARQAGYVEFDDDPATALARGEVDHFREVMLRNELLFVPMYHATDPNRPRRFAIRPVLQAEAAIHADLSTLHSILPAGLERKQLVSGDNGPYRTSVRLLIDKWAAQNGVEFAADPVVFGDEAGFTAEHNSADGAPIETITTPNRQPIAYLPEFLVVWKAGRGAYAK